MSFRTKHGSLELIKGSPVQVAFEICFFVREDEIRHDLSLTREERRAEALKRIEMEFGSDEIQYDEAAKENHRRLAKELGLPESTPWIDVIRANSDYLARLMGEPCDMNFPYLSRKAISLCAVELGLPRTADWTEVQQAFQDQKDEILARFNYEFLA